MLDIIDALDLLRRCADRDGLGNLMSLRTRPGGDHPIAWTSGLIGGCDAAPAVTVLDCSRQGGAQSRAGIISPGPDDRWPASPQSTLGAAAVLRVAEREGRRGGTWAECLAAADVATLRFLELLPDTLGQVDRQSWRSPPVVPHFLERPRGWRRNDAGYSPAQEG